MDHAQIVNELETLGLETDEASVYLRLLQVGGAKVSQLADHAAVSRSSLYRVLDELVDKGFVSKSLGRPTVYTPEDPDTIFDLSTQELESRLDRLDRVRDRVLGPLQELADDEGCDEAHHWKRIEGASRIYEVIVKRAQEADERIDVISNHALCQRHDLAAVEEAWRVLADRGREGITVNLLLGFEPPTEEVPDDVLDASAGVRSFQQEETVHFLLFDRRELVLVLKPQAEGDDGDEEMAVWTNAPGLLATHEALVESLWPQATPLG